MIFYIAGLILQAINIKIYSPLRMRTFFCYCCGEEILFWDSRCLYISLYYCDPGTNTFLFKQQTCVDSIIYNNKCIVQCYIQQLKGIYTTTLISIYNMFKKCMVSINFQPAVLNEQIQSALSILYHVVYIYSHPNCEHIYNNNVYIILITH